MKITHHPLIKFGYNTKIISKSTDFRIYHDAILLTPGEYCDSVVKSPTVYSDIELSKSATRWTRNDLNLDHSTRTLDKVGFVQNARWQDRKVLGDLYIYKDLTQNAKDTVAMIDAGLVNWLSVELQSEDYWNQDDNKRYAGDIEFIGTAICLHPADKDTRIVPEKHR